MSRFSVRFEPSALCVGVTVCNRRSVTVCPLPMLQLTWRRRIRVEIVQRQDLDELEPMMPLPGPWS